jgi:hypothetical protein
MNNISNGAGSNKGDSGVFVYGADGLTLINNGTINSTYAGDSNNGKFGYGIFFENATVGQQLSVTNAAYGTIEATGAYGIGVRLAGGPSSTMA